MSIGKNLEIMRNYGLRNSIPFWYIGFALDKSTEGTWPPVRTDDYTFSFQIYTSLVYGSKGYTHFLYWKDPASSFNGNAAITNGSRTYIYDLVKRDYIRHYEIMLLQIHGVEALWNLALLTGYL